MKTWNTVLNFGGILAIFMGIICVLLFSHKNYKNYSKDAKRVVCITYGSRNPVAIRYDIMLRNDNKCEIVLALSGRIVNRKEVHKKSAHEIFRLAVGAIKEMESFSHSQVSDAKAPLDERTCVITAYSEGATNESVIVGSNTQLLSLFNESDSLYELLRIASEGQLKGGRLVSPR